MNRISLSMLSIAATLLAALWTPPVVAHGEADESVADFQNHLDDYRAEIDAYVAELEPIVAAYADGQDIQPMVGEMIQRWEDVAVHAAIETRATVIYPSIWQAIIAFQQTALEGKSDAAVAGAAGRIEAALWQGYGALRLAATRVGEADAAHHDEGVAEHSEEAGASGPESVDRIIAELGDAVAAYENGDAARAESLIHDAYMQRFEYLEGDLIELDADLVSGLEKDFNATLPLLIQEGAAIEDVRATLDSMVAALERARGLLAEAEQSRSEVF